VPDNNWLLFCVLTNHALARLGAPADPPRVAADLQRVEEFARGMVGTAMARPVGSTTIYRRTSIF